MKIKTSLKSGTEAVVPTHIDMSTPSEEICPSYGLNEISANAASAVIQALGNAYDSVKGVVTSRQFWFWPFA